MNHSIPSPPEGERHEQRDDAPAPLVAVLSARGAFLLRLPLDLAEGYVRRHPGTRIADAAPADDAGSQRTIGAAVRATHAPEPSAPSCPFYALDLAA